MSKPSRGQKCECIHPRMHHNRNAGKCNTEECTCTNFKAIRTRQRRLKDDKPRSEKKAN